MSGDDWTKRMMGAAGGERPRGLTVADVERQKRDATKAYIDAQLAVERDRASVEKKWAEQLKTFTYEASMIAVQIDGKTFVGFGGVSQRSELPDVTVDGIRLRVTNIDKKMQMGRDATEYVIRGLLDDTVTIDALQGGGGKLE